MRVGAVAAKAGNRPFDGWMRSAVLESERYRIECKEREDDKRRRRLLLLKEKEMGRTRPTWWLEYFTEPSAAPYRGHASVWLERFGNWSPAPTP